MPAAKIPERASRVHKRTARYADDLKLLGARVRELRTARGLTLDDAAAAMDIDIKHLHKIEAGMLNVTMVTLSRLAVGLDIPIHRLFAPVE
jgi:transcriptional regulator with XRE-family HTH domain